MTSPSSLLIVEDKEDNALLLRKMLQPQGYALSLVGTGQGAIEHVRNHPCDLILLDVMLPDLDGLEVTRRLKSDPVLRYIPILLVTARSDPASVVGGLDAGADDYLTKPVERRELLARVRSALRQRELQQALLAAQQALEEKNRALEVAYQDLLEQTQEKVRLQAEVGDLKRQVADGGRLRDLVGKGPAMRRIFEQIGLVAGSDVTVLLRGETGTGKELVARALHQESARARGPFVAINLGAVPEGLLESELFGHEKGAFTGALARKPGRFERAAGGTLFLDEVGDVPKAMQVKLLRVIQEREFERVGGTQPISADVRIIAATHKDLEAMVASGEYRQDLYYRLNVVPIHLPPLRERPEDIPLLARHLLEKLARTHALPMPALSPNAVAALLAHSWPGNVRELENTLERALVLSGGGDLSGDIAASLPSRPVFGGGASGQNTETLGRASGGEVDSSDFSLPFKDYKHKLLELHERAYIVAALKRHRGNMAAAARETEVDAKTFARKIAEYRILRHEYLLRGEAEREDHDRGRQ